ncbi:hypothetical protein ASG90_12645 [Nocardioides sp. Soil797]|nr:hypothetical protein ASG90_12645 [Nocardioides sp. Soil797]
MNDIENELARRLNDSVPDAPETTNWGTVVRTRAARAKRTKMAGVAVIACLAVAGAVTIPGLVGSSDNSSPAPAGPPTASNSASPSESKSLKDKPPAPPEQGEVKTSEGNIIGIWEDGEMLGTPLQIAMVDGHEEILYAAKRVFEDSPGGKPMTYVAIGLRDGDRVLQTVSALAPMNVEEADGIGLYGGERRPDGTYRLIGSVPGSGDPSITDGSEPAHEMVTSSTEILPGFTVFMDTGAWRSGWDATKLAPLTVITSDAEVKVRERSWTG